MGFAAGLTMTDRGFFVSVERFPERSQSWHNLISRYAFPTTSIISKGFPRISDLHHH